MTDRDSRLLAIARWADYARTGRVDPWIAADAIAGLAGRIERPCATLGAENISGPERRSERHPGALASHLQGGG